ncbi:MAG: membrane integrity-associated transporter subunit PqiC [Sphingomonadales bacterium]|nr:membrane integrity-associated transporter subunit PqiC [Sphingomonadales bacterium]MBD3773678.1 membrane integrity-associated transporter subunit PqiC [Paracoccaceae bacterium]
MNFTPRILIAPVVALALSTGLAGCVSLSPKLPPSLLTLTPTSSAPAGQTAATSASRAIAVFEPEAPLRIDVMRVPVQIDDSSVAYLKDAQWVDKPARLFRQLLAETIRVKTGRMVIADDEPALRADAQLRGTLLDFGYDARASSVVVRFDAIRTAKDGKVETRRFEAVVPGIPAEAGPVGSALNDAANDVAGQVADWIG